MIDEKIIDGGSIIDWKQVVSRYVVKFKNFPLQFLTGYKEIEIRIKCF